MVWGDRLLGAGAVGPGDTDLATAEVLAEQLPQRHRIRHTLAWMVNIIFHINYRHFGPLGELLNDPEALLIFPVDHIAQDADGESVPHARENARKI